MSASRTRSRTAPTFLGPAPYPEPSSAGAKATMLANRRVDSKAEVRLRSALHGMGLRFRKDAKVTAGDLSVRADVLFPKRRLAVFVDGCFWHRCPAHASLPRANSEYWHPKLAGNVVRDRVVDAALTEGGWTVLRLWEHEPAAEAAKKVAEALAAAPIRAL